MPQTQSIITNGYTYPYRTNQGGIKAVYVGTWNDTSMTFTYGSGSTANQITAIGGVTMSFYKIQQRQQQGMATYAPVPSANGGISYTHTVECIIENPNNIMTNWLNLLDQDQWRLIVLDVLGQYWMYGLQNGAYTTGGAGGPGGKIADENKAIVQFKADEPLRPTMISAAAAATVISNS